MSTPRDIRSQRRTRVRAEFERIDASQMHRPPRLNDGWRRGVFRDITIRQFHAMPDCSHVSWEDVFDSEPEITPPTSPNEIPIPPHSDCDINLNCMGIICGVPDCAMARCTGCRSCNSCCNCNYSSASAAAIRRVFDYDSESAIAARTAVSSSVTD